MYNIVKISNNKIFIDIFCDIPNYSAKLKWKISFVKAHNVNNRNFWKYYFRGVCLKKVSISKGSDLNNITEVVCQ